MTKNGINPILIPQIPSRARPANNAPVQGQDGGEFQELLGQEKGQAGDEVEFSGHAMKRIKQRNLEMDNEEYLKIKGAIEKLRTKGGQDSLVVTNKAAYIVDVANNKIVTAMDKDDMAENVFTKIDSTLFVN